jgi:hypothetical protein
MRLFKSDLWGEASDTGVLALETPGPLSQRLIATAAQGFETPAAVTVR